MTSEKTGNDLPKPDNNRYVILSNLGWSDERIRKEFPDYDKLRAEHSSGEYIPGGAYS